MLSMMMYDISRLTHWRYILRKTEGGRFPCVIRPILTLNKKTTVYQ